jgi:hypothetical protein
LTTDERLDRLERELARARWFNRGLLVALVVCLAAGVVVWERVGQNGRYALSGNWKSGQVILDTRTSQRWMPDGERKNKSVIIDLGTIEKPTWERREVDTFYLTKGEPGPLGIAYKHWALMLIILSTCIVGLVLSFRRHPKKPGSQ